MKEVVITNQAIPAKGRSKNFRNTVGQVVLGGGGSATQTVVSTGGTADEAAHAARADVATLATLATQAQNLTPDSTDWATIQSLLQSLSDTISTKYLRKDLPDVAQKLITFLSGLNFGNGATGIDATGLATLSGLKILNTIFGIDGAGKAVVNGLNIGEGPNGIDKDGNAELASVKSNFKSGLSVGTGFGVYTDANGKSVGEIDKLIVRMKAIFAQLEVRKFAFTSGDVGYTSAGCRIDKVTQQLDSGDYRCYFLAEQDGVKISNDWHVGDQAMCRTSNIISRETSMAANRYYWRLVVSKGEETIDGKLYHYIDLSDTSGTLTLDGYEDHYVGYDTSVKIDGLVKNDAPQAEDSLVQLGSQTDPDRRYAYIIYVSTGERVDYNGINDYDLSSHITTKMGVHGTTVHSDYFEILGPTGVSTSLVSERGAWKAGETYGHYDHVSYNNATWLCNVGKGMTTTDEPKDGSIVWIKETYGADGNDAETYTLVLSRTDVYDYETDSVKVDVLYTKGATSLMLDKNSALSRKTYVYVFDGKEAVSSGEGGTSIDVGSSYSFKALCPGGQYVTIGLIRSVGGSWTLLESKTISVVRKGEDGAPGNDGEPGAAGEDAVTVRLVPDKVVVDTGDDGMVPDTALENVKAKVEVWRGNSPYFGTASLKNTSDGIGASVSGTVTDGYTVKIESIAKDPSTVTDGDQSSGYAYAQGWVDVNVNVDGVEYTVRLTVETNIHKVVSKLKRTADSISLSVSSLRQKVDGNKTETDASIALTEEKINANVTAVDDLGTRMSNVEQTADSISLKVSETVLKGNLLAGTMFRRESEVTWNNPAYKGVISTAVQLGGVNSVYLESASETDVYKGVKWAKIPVTAGKTYNMSFWYRTPDALSNGHFTIEVQAFKADGTQAEVFRPLVVWELPIPDNNVWPLYKGSMTLGSDVASVNVMIYLVTKGKMYVARPMLIEGSYVGWQRSEQDYDYIGGNLLDETKTLTKRGNLTDVDGTVTGNAFGWCSAIYAQGASPYTSMLKWLIPYDLNADYALSFMAKGTGKIQTHIYSSAGAADVALFTERECEDYEVGVWGSANYTLTPDWKRRTVRWRTKGTRTQANAVVVIRVDQSSEAYIAQPKLEKGCTATEWTDGDGDMVSTKALLATGIDIKKRKVTITSDNVQVQNNSGVTTMLLNSDGKIQAKLINAQEIESGVLRTVPDANGSYIEMYTNKSITYGRGGRIARESYLDEDGMPHDVYYKPDGTVSGDMSYQGWKAAISQIRAAYYENLQVASLGGTTLTSVISSAGTTYYKYHASYDQQRHIYGSDEAYNNMVYTSKSTSAATIPGGWYLNRSYSDVLWRSANGGSIANDVWMVQIMYFNGGKSADIQWGYYTKVGSTYTRTDEYGNPVADTLYPIG